MSVRFDEPRHDGAAGCINNLVAVVVVWVVAGSDLGDPVAINDYFTRGRRRSGPVEYLASSDDDGHGFGSIPW